MPTFTHNHTTYHYHIAGHGPPLILLHGFTGSLESWAPLLPALTRTHRVLTVDLPGHGRTRAPDSPAFHTMTATARGLAALFDHALGEPAHLLGYSMGGRLALYFALHYPDRVRSLLLESASPGLADGEERAARRQRDEALAARIEAEGVSAFVDFWERLPLFASQGRLPADVRARLRAQRLRNRPTGLANSLRGMGTGAQPSLWSRLGQVSAPTLLLVGGEDAKFRAIALQMARLLPRSQTVVFPGAGHTVHLERPRAFVGHVLPWLA